MTVTGRGEGIRRTHTALAGAAEHDHRHVAALDKKPNHGVDEARIRFEPQCVARFIRNAPRAVR